MINNAILYRIDPSWSQSLAEAEEGCATQRFLPLGLTQEKTGGWIEPRGEAHGPLLEAVGGQWLFKFKVESKSVPASVIKRKTDERAKTMEEQTGRKPGKREKKEWKEDILHELLPMAFTKEATTSVWIDPIKRILIVDTGTQSKADDIVTALVKCLQGLAVTLIATRLEPATAMSGWLASMEAPACFSIDREVELKAFDESKAVVRYAKHPLDIDEVRGHIESGKRPTRLAMTWEGRVSFVLTDSFQVKKIVYLDGVFKGGAAGDKAADNFDGDVAIATGELSKMMPDLIDALGGEMAMAAPTVPPTKTDMTVAENTGTKELAGAPF